MPNKATRMAEVPNKRRIEMENLSPKEIDLHAAGVLLKTIMHFHRTRVSPLWRMKGKLIRKRMSQDVSRFLTLWQRHKPNLRQILTQTKEISGRGNARGADSISS
jgi:hypothetical protein